MGEEVFVIDDLFAGILRDLHHLCKSQDTKDFRPTAP